MTPEQANQIAKLMEGGLSKAEAFARAGLAPPPPTWRDFDTGLTDQQLLVNHLRRIDGFSEDQATRYAQTVRLSDANVKSKVDAERLAVIAGMNIDFQIAERESPEFRQAFDQATHEAHQRREYQADLARDRLKREMPHITDADLADMSTLELIEAAGYTPAALPELPPIDVSSHPEYQGALSHIRGLDPEFVPPQHHSPPSGEESA